MSRSAFVSDLLRDMTPVCLAEVLPSLPDHRCAEVIAALSGNPTRLAQALSRTSRFFLATQLSSWSPDLIRKVWHELDPDIRASAVLHLSDGQIDQLQEILK